MLVNPPSSTLQLIVQPNCAKIEPEAQYLISKFTTHIFGDLICIEIHPIMVHTLGMTSHDSLLHTVEVTDNVGDT